MFQQGSDAAVAATPETASDSHSKRSAPPKLLFVMGFPRCGSTLLVRLLDQLDGWGAIGEAIDQLYCHRRVHVAPCGCGAPMTGCSFWTEIVAGLDDEARRFVTRFLRLRYLPLLALPWRPRRLRELERRFQESIVRFLAGAATKLGARIVVESSKLPMYALALARVPGLEVAAVHLVRDLRAVVASSTTAKDYLEAVPVHRVVVWWCALGLVSEWVLHSGRVRGLRVRYEDLVARPAEVITEVARLVGEEAPQTAHLGSRLATFGASHLLGSNPDKLEVGTTRISERAWTLPRWKRWLVTLAGAPVLARFGYLASAGAHAAATGRDER